MHHRPINPLRSILMRTAMIRVQRFGMKVLNALVILALLAPNASFPAQASGLPEIGDLTDLTASIPENITNASKSYNQIKPAIAADTPIQAPETSPAMTSAAQTQVIPAQPILFIENVGQFEAETQFKLIGGRQQLQFTSSGYAITIWEEVEDTDSHHAITSTHEITAPTSVEVTIDFVGANPDPIIEGFDLLSDIEVSYYRGTDPSTWNLDVPVWGGIRYVDLYPGINLEITFQDGRLIQHMVLDTDVNLDMVAWKIWGGQFISLIGESVQIETPLQLFSFPLITTEFSPTSSAVINGDQVQKPFTIETEDSINV